MFTVLRLTNPDINLKKMHQLFNVKFVLGDHCFHRSGLDVIKLFSCSTQLSMKFAMLINVKMPTIVGILTFISMINTTSERLKVRNFFICQYFGFYEHESLCSVSLVERENVL